MIVVKVTYQVKPEFVSTNQENIDSFMEDFRRLGDDFRYIVCLGDDGRTFTHLSMYKNEEVQKRVLDVESFKSFQQQRDDSGIGDSHSVEMMNLIAASFGVFG